MKGRFFSPCDFWKERQFDDGHDPLERNLIRLCKWVVIAVIAILLITFFCGCRSWKFGTKEKEEREDSVRIEYRERIVKVPVTVYVEVPVEQKEKMTKDSTSHLETSFAVSDASIIWIDGVAFLRHSLANKAQTIQKNDSVPVVYKDRVEWKTRRVYYKKTEIRERQLAWWQKGLMWVGGIAVAALVIFIVILLVKAFLRR